VSFSPSRKHSASSTPLIESRFPVESGADRGITAVTERFLFTLTGTRALPAEKLARMVASPAETDKVYFIWRTGPRWRGEYGEPASVPAPAVKTDEFDSGIR